MAIAVTHPKYVIRDGELLVVPPVGLEVTLYLFVVAAARDRLQQLCDREINLCAGRRYDPLGAFVVFYAADMVNVVPSGRIAERDFGVWVPVRGSGREARGLKPRVLSYTPYLWVDNSPALVGGRLVFGFPKHAAQLTLPVGSRDAASVTTHVMRWQGGDAEALEVLRIRRDGTGTWGAPGDVWANAAAAVNSLRMLRRSGALRQLLDAVTTTAGLPMVFLKQMPAADGSWNAAYQAVLEADVDVIAGATGGALAGSYEVEILECWSHDLVGRLGLKVQSRRQDQQPHRVYQRLFADVSATMTFKAIVRPAELVCERTRGAPAARPRTRSAVEEARARRHTLAAVRAGFPPQR